ncbi:lys-63-specific deubiquitinase BRCC36 [Passer domesticus]
MTYLHPPGPPRRVRRDKPSPAPRARRLPAPARRPRRPGPGPSRAALSRVGPGRPAQARPRHPPPLRRGHRPPGGTRAEPRCCRSRGRHGPSGAPHRSPGRGPRRLAGRARERRCHWCGRPGGGARGGRAGAGKMAVQAVHLEADAFLVCLNHALSTEKEEVMGLCIGEVDTSRIVHIHSVIILRRSDKRKDRVEISPEQLSAASTEAERLAEMTGRPMRVVGWYHSHPHITVWPSHVDVRTQAMYQMMDQGFVGLIFSCFIEDKNTKTGRILYTCFQSVQAQKSSEYDRIEIPIHVVPHETIGKVCLESAVELPKILCQEEQDAYRRIHSLTHLDSVTKIHNGSVFTKNLCSQMSAISGPLLQWLEDRLEQNKQRMQELQQEKEQLLEELAALE